MDNQAERGKYMEQAFELPLKHALESGQRYVNVPTWAVQDAVNVSQALAAAQQENEKLRDAFDAMHKHRYDADCERCNEIVAALEQDT